MRRFVSILALASALALTQMSQPTTASAVDVNVRFGTGHTFYFDEDPALTLIPESRVYYVSGPDYEMYRYGGYYYVTNGGYWYRARSARGPFQRIGYGTIPRQVVQVPVTYHRYSVKPNGRDPWANRWVKKDNGRGRARGHDNK